MANSLTTEFVPFTRNEYMGWLQDESGRKAQAAFADAKPEDCFHVFAGITDPKENLESLSKVNLKLPELIYRVANESGSLVVTYGTVMEIRKGMGNPYIESKRLLRSAQAEYLNRGLLIKHLRLHTVYGIDRPQSHMFLGQILEALETNSEFRMTSGRQFREYHHAEWVAEEIRSKIKSRRSEAVEITDGVRVSLADLATGIFDYFGRPELLKLGALPDPDFEAYQEDGTENMMTASHETIALVNRVSTYLQNCLNGYSPNSVER